MELGIARDRRAEQLPAFDPYDPAFLDDPYGTYARLQKENPVFWDETWGLTFFTRYADVAGILKDRRFGRDFHQRLAPDRVDPALYHRIYPLQWPQWTKFIRGSFIDLEPPKHTRIRRLVSKAFTRRNSEEFRPHIEQIAGRLVDDALARGGMEAISAFATPIPIALISELMGIPPPDRSQLLDWSHAIVKVFDDNVTEASGAAAEAAVIGFAEYLREVIARRRLQPGNDLISALVQVEEDGDRLAEDDLIATAILTLNAGHEATVHAVGNALLALIRHPDQFRRLRAEPTLLPSAAAELLRFDSPLQMFERWVLEDLRWGEVELAAGTKVGLLFGAANRDPQRFAEPHALDLARSDNHHLAFGAGIHRCVGEPLAIVELEAAIGAFAAGVAEMELDGPIDHLPSLVFRGLRSLPIRVSRS